MSELCDSLSVVFTDSPKIEDHLFAKAIRWADQNPEDIIFWARRKALEKIPDVDVDWSSKIRALRSIRFGYNKSNLLRGCIDEAIKMESEIAAIICSLKLPKTCSQMGSLLASLAAFCHGNDGRAVVVIDLREEVEMEEEKDDDKQDETDPFENSDFLDEEEEEKTGELKTTERSQEDRNKFLRKLKLVSGIYTKNVLTFDGNTFLNVCL